MGEQIKVEVPKNIIEEELHRALAEALCEPGRKDIIVKELVNKAMMAKVNSYDNRTILQAAFHEAIQGAAKEAMKEIVSDLAPKIKEHVIKRLKSEPDKFAEKIANSVVDGIDKNLLVTVRCNID